MLAQKRTKDRLQFSHLSHDGLGCNLDNLEKQILQKYREPTILENSRHGFIESVHEN